MVIKETNKGYIKGNKYEVNENLKSNFHLSENSTITQVKRRINKFGFEIENLNSSGNRKGENILMFIETPQNQNKVIPNTLEYDVTKENPNKNMDCELLLKIMNTIIDSIMGRTPKSHIAITLGITPNTMKNYIAFLKKIGFINSEENKKYHWMVDTSNYTVRPAKNEEYLPFYKMIKETKDFKKTKEFFGYFCYCTTLYGINNNHKLIKYTNLNNLSKETLKQFENEFENEFGIGFDFE